MVVGNTATVEDGFGFRIPDRDRHGLAGEVVVVIMAGLHWARASILILDQGSRIITGYLYRSEISIMTGIHVMIDTETGIFTTIRSLLTILMCTTGTGIIPVQGLMKSEE